MKKINGELYTRIDTTNILSQTDVKILKLLLKHPNQSTTAITQRLCKDRDTVRKRLLKLLDSGFIIRVAGKNKYLYDLKISC